MQVSNAESVLTVHGTGNGSRALRLVSVLNLYIKNECGQVSAGATKHRKHHPCVCVRRLASALPPTAAGNPLAGCPGLPRDAFVELQLLICR